MFFIRQENILVLAMSPNYRTIATRHGAVSVADTGGNGFPLLMLHGSANCKDVFRPQLEGPLAERHRLIAIDLLGHGQSANAEYPGTAYTLGGFAESAADVIAALGVKRLAVFGWSLGGHIAIEMLARQPIIAGLMLTGTPPVAPGPLGLLRGFQTNWDLLLASKEHFTERDVVRFHYLCFGDHGSAEMLEAIARSDGRVRAIAVSGMMRGDGADQKRTVETAKVPIAMVNGEHEPIARLGYIDGLDYQTLWDGRCHVIAGAAHAPFIERPEVFNALLNRFIANVEAYQQPVPMALPQSA